MGGSNSDAVEVARVGDREYPTLSYFFSKVFSQPILNQLKYLF